MDLQNLNTQQGRLYQQETDLEVISALLPFVKHDNFIDVGAEKGLFSKFLTSFGLSGTLFESSPKFQSELQILAEETNCRFFSFAVNDDRIHHKKIDTVACRTLDSLYQENILPQNVGILKIDTKGNDLDVLKDMKLLKPEIIICKFFMPGIYISRKVSHPDDLILKAKQLGFNHFVAIKRFNVLETLSIDQSSFVEREWGSLIFINDSIFTQANKILTQIRHSKTEQFQQLAINTINQLQDTCDERQNVIHLQEKQLRNRNQTDIVSRLEAVEYLVKTVLYTGHMGSHSTKRKHWQRRVVDFLKPRLGHLYQYGPRLLVIPKKYSIQKPLTKIPTISIVTPSYNQAQFLEDTILSVCEQNYPRLEYVIQDGGSTDQSPEIIQRHAASFKHWQSRKDAGQANAINLGFAHTSGEIMAYLNSDDILLPGALHYVARYFEQHPEIDVIYGHRVLINEENNEIGRWIVPKHDTEVIMYADYIPQETLFWRRRMWEKVGGKVDESFRFAMDWDLIIRFQQAGAKFARLPRFLGGFRVHSQQKTNAMNQVGWEEMKRIRSRVHGRHVSDIEVHAKIQRYLKRHVIINKLYRLGILRY